MNIHFNNYCKLKRIVEPTTGKVYPVDNENYLGIESLFNSLNYWVNMQPCVNALKGISFDIADNSKWEYVFSTNTLPGYAIKDTDDEDDDLNINGRDKSMPFEMPFTWVEQLQILREKYNLKTPSGASKHVYQNVQVVQRSLYRYEQY